jgi:hypothetical protein
MEYENKYGASKGVAGAGLGLGIAGTALGVMAGGLNGIGGILGGGRSGCGEHQYSRYDAEKDARIAELETEVKLRDANTFTMGEMGKLRDYVDGKFAHVEQQLCDQRVYNTANTTAVTCIQGQVAQLMALTKCVIPIGNVCPQPMAQFNSWTAPTTPTTGA